jgi:hypothetical protein
VDKVQLCARKSRRSAPLGSLGQHPSCWGNRRGLGMKSLDSVEVGGWAAHPLWGCGPNFRLLSSQLTPFPTDGSGLHRWGRVTCPPSHKQSGLSGPSLGEVVYLPRQAAGTLGTGLGWRHLWVPVFSTEPSKGPQLCREGCSVPLQSRGCRTLREVTQLNSWQP